MRPFIYIFKVTNTFFLYFTGLSKMDLRQLRCLWQNYYHLGASPSTWKVYNAGLSRYQKFCKMANRSIFPASEDNLLLFTAHLATEGILASTIKVYLSAIRSSHVAAGRHEEFSKQITPRLQQVIKGIQKQQAITSPQRIHRPITIEILEGIRSILSQNTHNNIITS